MPDLFHLLVPTCCFLLGLLLGRVYSLWRLRRLHVMPVPGQHRYLTHTGDVVVLEVSAGRVRYIAYDQHGYRGKPMTAPLGTFFVQSHPTALLEQR